MGIQGILVVMLGIGVGILLILFALVNLFSLSDLMARYGDEALNEALQLYGPIVNGERVKSLPPPLPPDPRITPETFRGNCPRRH